MLQRSPGPQRERRRQPNGRHSGRLNVPSRPRGQGGWPLWNLTWLYTLCTYGPEGHSTVRRGETELGHARPDRPSHVCNIKPTVCMCACMCAYVVCTRVRACVCASRERLGGHPPRGRQRLPLGDGLRGGRAMEGFPFVPQHTAWILYYFISFHFVLFFTTSMYYLYISGARLGLRSGVIGCGQGRRG